MIGRKDDSVNVVLSPLATWALSVASWLFVREGYTCTITSAHDGDTHADNSKHYAARQAGGGVDPNSADAFDLRTRQMPPANKRAIGEELAAALGTDFDVILEDTHLHVEYDPR
jgi:hypothetical protein